MPVHSCVSLDRTGWPEAELDLKSAVNKLNSSNKLNLKECLPRLLPGKFCASVALQELCGPVKDLSVSRRMGHDCTRRPSAPGFLPGGLGGGGLVGGGGGAAAGDVAAAAPADGHLPTDDLVVLQDSRLTEVANRLRVIGDQLDRDVFARGRLRHPAAAGAGLASVLARELWHFWRPSACLCDSVCTLFNLLTVVYMASNAVHVHSQRHTHTCPHRERPRRRRRDTDPGPSADRDS